MLTNNASWGMVSPLRNTKARLQSPQRTVGELFNIPVSDAAGKGGRRLGDASVRKRRLEARYNSHHCGARTLEVSSNEIIMADRDRTSRMPLVRGRAARSIQSSLDRRDFKHSKWSFATHSGFRQPQSIRGSLLVPTPYR